MPKLLWTRNDAVREGLYSTDSDIINLVFCEVLLAQCRAVQCNAKQSGHATVEQPYPVPLSACSVDANMNNVYLVPKG